MSEDQIKTVTRSLTNVIESILTDLGSDSAEWSNVDQLLKKHRENEESAFGNFPYRLRHDTLSIAQVPLHQVRQSLKDVLGERGFRDLLNLSDEDKSELAYLIISVEWDSCAAEGYGEYAAFSPRSWEDRLPYPIPYFIDWTANAMYKSEYIQLLKVFMADLRAGSDTWKHCDGSELSASLANIRALLPDSAGEAATPAQIRIWLKNVFGQDGLEQLLNVGDDVLSNIPLPVGGRYHSAPEYIKKQFPQVPEGLPTVVIYLTDWATEKIGLRSAGLVLKKILADVDSGEADWPRTSALQTEDLFWYARDLIDKARGKNLVKARETLVARLGADNCQKLWSISDEDATKLAVCLFSDVKYESRPWMGGPSPSQSSGPAPSIFSKLAECASNLLFRRY